MREKTPQKPMSVKKEVRRCSRHQSRDYPAVRKKTMVK